MKPDDPARRASAGSEAPPFLGWRRLYAIVIVALAACIAALAWLTGHYR